MNTNCPLCGLEHSKSWTCAQAKANAQTTQTDNSKASTDSIEASKEQSKQEAYYNIKRKYWEKQAKRK